MTVSTVKQYGLNITMGAGIGAIAAALFKNAQLWKSPNGGVIACLFAERVVANPLHINMGFVFAATATVPEDYVLTGSLVPGLCSFNVLLVSCVCLGILIGAYTAYRAKPAQNRP